MFKATCSECGKECEVPFKPEEGRPVKCGDCFKKRRPQRKFGGGGNRGGFNRQREMHDAKCSECGKDCQVPFKPKDGSNVKCKDCYVKSK